jgi:hypothetical protein
VQLPAGMSLSVVTAGPVVIRRRWLRGTDWLSLAVFAALVAYVAYLWGNVGATPGVAFFALVVASSSYHLAATFVNSTVVTVAGDRVSARHGPLPTFSVRNSAVEKSDIDQLFSTTLGDDGFAVQARLKSGQTLELVAPLVTPEEALFIEQELERRLGLVDFAVEGELSEVNVQGKRFAGAFWETARVFVFLAFIGGIYGLSVLIDRTEVKGRLQAKGALGSWVFEPDGCTSGQREGFGGVILTASASPGRVVRVVRDPVRGDLVMVASPGQPEHVLGGNPCPHFEVNVERTNTNINDIWAVNGSVAVECDELSGSAAFEGCH